MSDNERPNSVSLDDLFRGSSPRPAANPYRGQFRGSTDRRHIGQRQREEAEARARERAEAEAVAQPRQIETQQSFVIDWYSETHWVAPNGAYPIMQMESQHLWQTIIWCVRNIEALCLQYSRPADAEVLPLAAKKWLRLQPAFRSLLKESIRRQLTLPPDVYQYVQEYVLKKGEMPSYEPWNDPAARAVQEDMSEFLSEPTNPDDNYGKETRSIDL